MSALWDRSSRWLTWFHRWAGVVLCLVFAMWFASGAVLHFVGFPALSAQERHQRSLELDLDRIALAPSQALAKLPDARDVRLLQRAGHPAYVAEGASGRWCALSAESGDALPDVTREEARRIAESFGGVSASSVTGPFLYDQWIVHQHFDPYRPLYRVRLADAARTDLYVSARTGEVLQRTGFAERAWNWFGAVAHWIYFTPLRESWTAWNQVVWWLSLIALTSIAVGTWLGVLRTIANRRAHRKGFTPFRGWMRWHHLIGLFASLVSLTWMLSGWLSMDHGRFFSTGQPTPGENAALTGLTLHDRLIAVSLETLKEVHATTEIDFNAIDGRPFMTTYGPRSRAAVVFLNDRSHPLAAIPARDLLTGVKRVWPDARAISGPSDTDDLYRRAESSGADAVAFVTTRPSSRRAYVDPETGRFLVTMDTSRRSYAWVYYALHTFQVPGLIDHPSLRTVVVLGLLALGFASSVTGIVLSVKRLSRQFA